MELFSTVCALHARPPAVMPMPTWMFLDCLHAATWVHAPLLHVVKGAQLRGGLRRWVSLRRGDRAVARVSMGQPMACSTLLEAAKHAGSPA